MAAGSKLSHRRSLRAKVTLAMAGVAVLVVAAILGTNFHIRRTQLLEEFQTFVRGAAGTTALALSGEEIKEIHSPNDATTDPFLPARRKRFWPARAN